MSWTTPITWLFDQIWSATLFNQQIRDNLTYLKNRPFDLAEFGETDQTGIAAATWTKVTNSDLEIIVPITCVLEFNWRLHVYSTTAASRYAVDIFDVDNGVYLSSGTATPKTNGLGLYNTNAAASVGSTGSGGFIHQNVAAGTRNYELHINSTAASTTVENSATDNAFWCKEIS